MALALSPQQQPRPAVLPIEVRAPQTGLKLSMDCRARRNNDVRQRYLAQARLRQRRIYMRRRIVASIAVLTIAAAACLGVRALASRGDGSASLPTVTPRGSTVLVASPGMEGSAQPMVDVSGAFIQGQQVYVVQPGDTLWSIASSLTDGNIRTYVGDLIDLNGSASIDVGQRLVLPVN